MPYFTQPLVNLSNHLYEERKVILLFEMKELSIGLRINLNTFNATFLKYSLMFQETLRKMSLKQIRHSRFNQMVPVDFQFKY